MQATCLRYLGNEDNKAIKSNPPSGTFATVVINMDRLRMPQGKIFRKDLVTVDTSKLMCSLVLFFIGIALIILGTVEALKQTTSMHVVGLLTIGGLFLIPGAYNIIQVIRAYWTNRDSERQRLLNSI